MSTKITDKRWTKIYDFLKSCPGVYAGQEKQCRLFIEGVHWIARSGAQWRLLPEKYGNRFEKLVSRYFSFLSFIGALIWLR
jgi:transposase